MWSMDEWDYVEREVVTDPKDRQWTVALMDVLGQKGDPDVPNKLLELQYSGSGALQYERGYATLPDAQSAYTDLLAAVIGGTMDPSQPVFRQDLED
jgi:hypothetical protein